jgi:hypothetical protein
MHQIAPENRKDGARQGSQAILHVIWSKKCFVLSFLALILRRNDDFNL